MPVTLPPRPKIGQSSNAQERRLRELFFDQYCHPEWIGIDIGSGPDPLFPGNPNWRLWDRQDGDATLMAGIPDDYYDAVYASHILEDFEEPIVPLRNWYRILRPGGYMTISVPHRDRYERKKELPSIWNAGHRTFYLPDHAEPPCTRSLYADFRAACPYAELISLRVLEYGWVFTPPEQHAGGEYSIELVCRKPKDS